VTVRTRDGEEKTGARWAIEKAVTYCRRTEWKNNKEPSNWSTGRDDTSPDTSFTLE
jgi:hypothetical protein